MLSPYLSMFSLVYLRLPIPFSPPSLSQIHCFWFDVKPPKISRNWRRRRRKGKRKMMMMMKETEKMDGKVLDDIIRRLLEGKGGKQAQLSEAEIRQLCVNSRQVFLSQPNLLRLHAPIKICGQWSSILLSFLLFLIGMQSINADPTLYFAIFVILSWNDW